MKREQRYLVVKIKDAKAALADSDDWYHLLMLMSFVADWRKDKGKPPLECVVVESDWPEYETTWSAIAKRMDTDVGHDVGERMMDTKETLTLKAWQQENAELQDENEALRELVKTTFSWGRFHRDEKERLRAENKALQGCIPAYRPCPCDCVVERDGQYFVECDCFNQGGLMDAHSWATEMSIIARFEKVLKQAERQE